MMDWLYVEDLRDFVEDRCGLAPERVIFVHKGKVLDETRSLMAQGVQQHDSIRLKVRPVFQNKYMKQGKDTNRTES